jgi:NADPH-dependent 2,4-dienoyl-CoA reductase/sulfur reductase-like enzyme/Fe-S-cluster-containing hydrogenase component 2/CRP-like cAMP-binding protein
MMRSSYVIIGNGIAGVTAAEVLRAEDAECALTIVADDPFPVYYRPALKDFLGGHLTEEKLWARPTNFYQEQDIRFLPARVTGLDAQQHLLRLHNGKLLQYDRLLLAQGARARTLSCPGLNLGGVFTLRSVSDYQHILQRLAGVRHVVVCGSGTLALESAETLVQRGYEVTHLLRGQQLWSEVLDAVASDMVLQEERRIGIDVCTDEEIAQIIGQDGEVCGVQTTRGRQIACELVLIAVGIEPAIDFLRGSGVVCQRGVRVDDCMRASVPDVYAAGDVVETVEALSGRARLVGQWYPAIQQARIAAQHMAGTSSAPSQNASNAFYNATFLRGLDFVSLGLTTRPAATGFYEVVAEPQPRSYRKVILHNGVAVGALLLGERGQALALKRAIDHHVNLAPIARQLFASDFDLDAWLTRQGVPAPLLALAGNATGEMHRADLELQTDITRIIPPAVLRDLPETPTLVLIGADGMPHTLSLVEGRRYAIGRDAQNEIVLTDPSTSRQHAEIAGTPAGFSLSDLGSRYGVFLNRKRLQGSVLLKHGDRVVIGNVLIYYSCPREPVRGTSGKIRSVSGSRVRGAQVRKPVVVGLEHRGKVEALSESRLAFEIDMCIGCNRCMDACPVPGSKTISIAALNQANVTEIIPPTLARFTHECIMCGSCVPVCPVDNHRDLLMLALKQRIGLSWKSQPNMAAVNQAVPTGWSLAQLVQHLREQRILNNPEQVPDTYLLHIIAASRPLILEAEEVLLREGEYGRDLYLILEGQLALTTSDREENELLLARLKRGEYVGEDGMLTGQPYKVSVRAQAPTLVFQVPEQAMQRLMELVPGAREYFERCVQATSLQTILARLDIFEGVAERDVQELIHRSVVKQYERNERLFAEDRRGRPSRETLHILLEGFVKVARHTLAGTGHGKSDERIIAYRQGGDYFAGGLDLLGDGQAVTVTTINRCRVAEVPRQAVLELFRRYPAVEERFASRLREYLETAASVHTPGAQARARLPFIPTSEPADPTAQEGLHELVNDGVVEGTEVLIIDLDRCIHCNECEDACERRHGHSRMNRKGMVVGNISITTACRQCQDPVCMLCSRAGIARHPNGEVYITESCIGCGICAERCPYGAISIAQVEETEQANGPWQRLNAWFARTAGTEQARKSLPMLNASGGARGQKNLPVVSSNTAGGSRAVAGPLDIFPTRNGYDELRKKIAIKCDLCAGYRDQACVQACPTGAALRVQPTRFFGSTEEILRKRTI